MTMTIMPTYNTKTFVNSYVILIQIVKTILFQNTLR